LPAAADFPTTQNEATSKIAIIPIYTPVNSRGRITSPLKNNQPTKNKTKHVNQIIKTRGVVKNPIYEKKNATSDTTRLNFVKIPEVPVSIVASKTSKHLAGAEKRNPKRPLVTTRPTLTQRS
jgi:hypothetical protein